MMHDKSSPNFTRVYGLRAIVPCRDKDVSNVLVEKTHDGLIKEKLIFQWSLLEDQPFSIEKDVMEYLYDTGDVFLGDDE